jgi:hypothetical protein
MSERVKRERTKYNEQTLPTKTETGHTEEFIDRWWLKRSKLIKEVEGGGGQPLHFDSPETLKQAILEYFEWMANRPLLENGTHFGVKGRVNFTVPRMRAMTLTGMANFLGTTIEGLRIYGKRSKEYFEVLNWAQEVMYTQKFEGAAAGFLNHSIIARDLGLADKRELTGAGGSPLNPSQHPNEHVGIDVSKLNKEELKQLANLIRKTTNDGVLPNGTEGHTDEVIDLEVQH